MPKFLEDKLRSEYGNNPRAIYGTMNKLGAMHGSKETAKGREMERKHEADMTKTPKAKLREMRIEVHHDKAGKLTGHTVHHEYERKTSKSPAFYEETPRESHPFGAGEHEKMVAHVKEHLGLGGKAEAESEGEEEGE